MSDIMNWLVLQLEINPARTWVGLIGVLGLSIYFLWLVVILESNGFHFSVDDFDEPTNEKPNRNEDES